MTLYDLIPLYINSVVLGTALQARSPCEYKQILAPQISSLEVPKTLDELLSLRKPFPSFLFSHHLSSSCLSKMLLPV